MRLLQVVAGLDPSHGGPSYSVPRLCAALRSQGAEVQLHTVGRQQAQTVPTDARFHRQDFEAVPLVRGLRASTDLRRAVDASAAGCDVVHNHGLWLLPNIYAARAAARCGRPFVVSPRGMLAPEALKFSKRKKRLFAAWVQNAAFRDAALWHATSQEEAADIRAFGVAAPIAVIPNGIDLPAAEATSARSDSSEKCLISLGRLHPKKGLDGLVRAWAAVWRQRPDWRLRIVGPDEDGYAAQLQALASDLAVQRFAVEPALYGDQKWQALRSADLFVLPTRSENFGLSVAEALAAGAPVICTTGAPWEGLRTEACGWWIDQGDAPLIAALLEATSTPLDHLDAMGARGRAWMERDFAWEFVADQMMNVYTWLVSGGAPPACIKAAEQT